MNDAREAMKAADLGALQRVAAAHPELLHPSDYDISAGRTLMGVARWQERNLGAAVMRSIVEWLEGQGFDRQLELNRRPLERTPPGGILTGADRAAVERLPRGQRAFPRGRRMLTARE